MPPDTEREPGKQHIHHNMNTIIDILLKKNNFEWQVSLIFFVPNEKILLSHIKQLSQSINSTNHKIHYFDQTSKDRLHTNMSTTIK